MAKHKHYELIVAWANGAKVQFKAGAGDNWIDITTPIWSDNSIEYRIKTEEKKLTPCYLWAKDSGEITCRLYSEKYMQKYTFIKDKYPIKCLWSETMLDLGDEE